MVVVEGCCGGGDRLLIMVEAYLWLLVRKREKEIKRKRDRKK